MVPSSSPFALIGTEEAPCPPTGLLLLLLAKRVMLRNKIPEFFHPEIRHLITLAFEDAWQELKNEELAEP
jgi:hypothetical protein